MYSDRFNVKQTLLQYGKNINFADELQHKMTNEDRFLLKELKANVQRLFQEYEQLKAINNSLEEKVVNLNQEIAKLQDENADLRRENENIKLANQLLTGKDEDGEARRKINNLIREIDKCIALLNK